MRKSEGRSKGKAGSRWGRKSDWKLRRMNRCSVVPLAGCANGLHCFQWGGALHSDVSMSLGYRDTAWWNGCPLTTRQFKLVRMWIQTCQTVFTSFKTYVSFFLDCSYERAYAHIRTRSLGDSQSVILLHLECLAKICKAKGMHSCLWFCQTL